VLLMHVNEDVLNEKGAIDSRKTDLVARMGGHFYCRAHGDALFELAQPTTHVGIGFDRLPASVRNSRVLTGNDLGQLANVPALPDETAVNEHKLTELSDTFIHLQDKPQELEAELHRIAQRQLAEGRTVHAWKTLLAYND
jgi:hypothetical protein